MKRSKLGKLKDSVTAMGDPNCSTNTSKANDSGSILSPDDLKAYMDIMTTNSLYTPMHPWSHTFGDPSPKNGSGGNWRNTTFFDLCVRDEIVLSPQYCGFTHDILTKSWHSKSYVVIDNASSPVFGGKFGEITGTVERIDFNYNYMSRQEVRVRVSWGTGEESLFICSGNGDNSYLKYYGLVLRDLFAKPATASKDPKITLKINDKLLSPVDVFITGVDLGHEEPKEKPKPKGVSFDDVILSKKKKDQVLEAIEQVNNYDLIFNEWGFGDKIEKGRAVSMLFWGKPGTGKTYLGQAIANHLGYKLQMISTAEIESSEPGGAERSLKSFFKAAEDDKKTVLFFDEADSLIHDRSNIGMILGAQVNALLTELEKYTGIAIFTTNRLGVLDTAFERRLSLKLEFTLPTPKQRMKIWKNMFPEKAPLAEDIRWEGLAQAEIAGGHIKNVVLKAARRAAAGNKLITDDILWDALEEEVESMELYHGAHRNAPKIAHPSYELDETGRLSKGAGTQDGMVN